MVVSEEEEEVGLMLEELGVRLGDSLSLPMVLRRLL